MTTKEYVELQNKPDDKRTKEENKAIIDFNKELCKKYPWVKPQLDEYKYEYTELDGMPDGWRIGFGDTMCEEIQKELERLDQVDSYYIEDIKEKWGCLDWYDSGTSDIYGDVDRIIYLKDRNERPVADDTDKEIWFYEEPVIKNDQTMFRYAHYPIIVKSKIEDIVDKYCELSKTTCIRCGKPAKYTTKGWIAPFCKDCKKELESDKTFYDEFEPI